MSETEREQITEWLRRELDSLAPEMVWCCETMHVKRCIRVNGVRRQDHYALRYPFLVNIDVVSLAGARQVASFVCSELAPGAPKDFPPAALEMSKHEQ